MSASFFNGFSPSTAFPAALKRGNRRRLLARGISMLLISTAAWSDAAPDPSAASAAPPARAGGFVTINRLGDSDQEAALRTGQLLSHHRSTDPFGNIIRGPYKALPPVVEHPTATPGQTAAAAPAVHVPTVEQAVQELSIGAVNVRTHEMLIGSRLIREGDLLVLESEGHQFVVWVQDIGVRAVTFCDINIQKRFVKPFGTGPKDLPVDSVQGKSAIRDLLPKDAPP